MSDRSDNEVEINHGNGDDYEVVPVGPIKKLERRLDEMEQQQQQGGSGGDRMVGDMLDIMKTNQKIVNDMTESTHELKNSVEDLTHKMDEVVDNMNSFMDLLKEASEVDMEGEVMGDMESRISRAIGDEMQDVASDIKESNKEVVENLNNINESLRRAYASQDSQNYKPQQNSSGQSQQTSRQMGGSSQSQSRGSSQTGSSNRSSSGSQSNSGSGGMQQMSSGNQQSGSEGNGLGSIGNDSDRMEKLKKKFSEE